MLSLCLVTISVLLPLQIARFVMFSNQIFKNFGLFTTDGLAVHSPNSAGLHFFFLSLLAFGKLWTLPKFTQNLNSYKLLSSDSFFFLWLDLPLMLTWRLRFYVNFEDGGVVCVMFMDSVFFFQIKRRGTFFLFAWKMHWMCVDTWYLITTSKSTK